MRRVGPLRGPLALCAAGLVALVVSACGSSSTAANSSSAITVAGSTLSIWVAQPPGDTGGSAVADVLDAEKLAFSQSGGRAGSFHLRFELAHGAETSDDARDAVSDRTAIAYLGDDVPGASGVSLQITNELGLLQVSPADTAVYLTQSTPAVVGAPVHFYPAHGDFHETFARVVPNTAREAPVLVARMRARGVRRLFVTDDGSEYGRSVALEVRSAAGRAGISVTGTSSGADAAFYGATPSAAATSAVDRLATGVGAIYAPSGLYDDSWVDGLSPAAQRALTVSAPGFLPSAGNPAERAFVAAFARRYGHTPAPQAVFGYEAMSALIAVLRAAGAHAAERTTVAEDFRGLHDRASALGTYSLDGGDTSIAPFVLATVSDGKLVPRSAG